MKKFFMVTPQQPEGSLREQVYAAPDCKELAYGEPTHFPMIPLINGYTKPGEEVKLVTITYGEPSNCANNLKILESEVKALEERNGVRIDLESVDVPFDDSVAALIHSYQLLVDRTEDDDVLHACITFGSKPMPIMLTMAMQYARRIRRDARIECVVYGQMEYSKKPATARIYDVTALMDLDEQVNLLATQRVQNPERVLRLVLGIGGESNV